MHVSEGNRDKTNNIPELNTQTDKQTNRQAVV